MFDEKFHSARKQYESLNKEQQIKFIKDNHNDAKVQEFARNYARYQEQARPAFQAQQQTQQSQQQAPQQSAPVQETQQNQPQYQESQQGQQQEVQSQGGMQKQVTEQQTQGAPQFGYQTDEVYRKQRDAHIAQTLYTQNPNSFDYDTVYRYVRSEAQGVSDRDIHNTVRNIQSQYLQYGRLGAMKTGSVEKLREGLMNGQYSQSDLELLKTQDPERYNEYIAHEEKMNAMSNAKHNAMVGQKLMDGKSVKEERKHEEILVEKAREYFGVIDYKEEIIEQYKESLNAPEIQKHKNKMLDAQREMDEIDDSLDTLREDLMKQYPGIPKTQLNAILQDRSYKLLKRKNELHRDYVRSKGEVQFAVDMAGKNLEADLKGIEIQRMELSDKMQALGFAKGLMEFETPQQKRDAELEQIRKKAELQAELSDINSKDPKIQFNAVMQALDQYYKDFGSIILRPQAQAAQDIINQAKREKISVGEAMRKNFTEPLQGKSGYKMLMNRQYGISNEVKVPDIVSIGGQSYQYDQSTGQFITPQIASGAEFTDYQMQGRANRHNNPTAMTTDVAKSLGMIEGIDYVRGDSFGGGRYYTAKLLGNGVDTTIKAFDKIANDPNRSIFYTQGGKQRRTHTGMSDEAWSKLSKQEKIGVIEKMYNNEEARQRRNFGAFNTIGENTSVGKSNFLKTATADQIEELQNIYEALQRIYPKNPDGSFIKGFEGAVGASWDKVTPSWIKGGNDFFPGSDAASYKTNFENFINLQVLPNLAKLKGAISDKDILFIQSTASALSLGMSEEAFINNLDQIKRKIEEKLGIVSPFGTEYIDEWYGAGAIAYSSTLDELADLPLDFEYNAGY